LEPPAHAVLRGGTCNRDPLGNGEGEGKARVGWWPKNREVSKMKRGESTKQKICVTERSRRQGSSSPHKGG